ncbi:hypothetical protein C0989_004033 [Termitomyces sp. Mn162]|nr:hypothetical protein C0989_004033 [Termitomyces sp. Mn162]
MDMSTLKHSQKWQLTLKDSILLLVGSCYGMPMPLIVSIYTNVGHGSHISNLSNSANNRYDRSIKNALTGGTARTQTTTTSKEATTTSKEASTISKVATTAHKTSSTPLPELILPFNDPRKTARVKRPQGFTPFPRDTVPTPTARGRPINSRFFRF